MPAGSDFVTIHRAGLAPPPSIFDRPPLNPLPLGGEEISAVQLLIPPSTQEWTTGIQKVRVVGAFMGFDSSAWFRLPACAGKVTPA